MSRTTLLRLAPAAVASALTLGALTPASAATPDEAGFTTVADVSGVDAKLDDRLGEDVLVNTAWAKTYSGDAMTITVANGLDGSGVNTRWAIVEVSDTYTGAPDGATDIQPAVLDDDVTVAVGDLGGATSTVAAQASDFLPVAGGYEVVLSSPTEDAYTGFHVATSGHVSAGWTAVEGPTQDEYAAAAADRDAAVADADGRLQAELARIAASYQPVRDLATEHGHPELDSFVTTAKTAYAAAAATYEEAVLAAGTARKAAQKAHMDAQAAVTTETAKAQMAAMVAASAAGREKDATAHVETAAAASDAAVAALRTADRQTAAVTKRFEKLSKQAAKAKGRVGKAKALKRKQVARAAYRAALKAEVEAAKAIDVTTRAHAAALTAQTAAAVAAREAAAASGAAKTAVDRAQQGLVAAEAAAAAAAGEYDSRVTAAARVRDTARAAAQAALDAVVDQYEQFEADVARQAHADEVAGFQAVFEAAVAPRPRTHFEQVYDLTATVDVETPAPF